jgi:7-cyano-7-deazaguanine synthase
MSERGKDLVVLSGGLDSTTVLALVDQLSIQPHGQDRARSIECIVFDYGQRHRAELDSAHEVAAAYGHRIHEQGILGLGKGGVLMQHGERMPHQTYEELKNAEGPSPTYVPFRNGTFLSLATSHALERNADTVWIGVHADDAHNWAYPDCTPEFIGAMQAAIYIGTYHKVRLMAPFQYYTKAQIIKIGKSLGAPYEKTLSCYEGRRPACGECPTCVARIEAFKEAGFRDPLEYEKDRLASEVTE